MDETTAMTYLTCTHIYLLIASLQKQGRDQHAAEKKHLFNSSTYLFICLFIRNACRQCLIGYNREDLIF